MSAPVSSAARRIAGIVARSRVQHDLDPLAGFEFHSERQKLAVELVCRQIEVYVRAPNKWGKTKVFAALGTSFARGRRVLGKPRSGPDDPNPGEVQLPTLPIPNVGVVLMQSYGQGAESVVGAYKKALGRFGTKMKKLPGGLGNVGLIMVKTALCQHADREECDNCSKIYFVSGQGVPSTGFHCDWIHGDEPPNEDHWRELRFRSEGNAAFYSMISATPIKKSGYAWLQRDFAGCLNQVYNERYEMVGRLEDNRFLTREYVARLKRKARNDPFERARLYGEYVDVTGSCPFNSAGLSEAEARAEQPARYAAVPTFGQGFTEDGEREVVWALREHAQGAIEIWEPWKERERWIMAVDPSSGAKNPDKSDDQQLLNPAGINMVSVRGKRHALRFNGYMPPRELGQMARAICAHYRDDVLLVVEMNAGWGDSFLLGFGLDYPHIYREHRVAESGVRQRFKVGWYQSMQKKAVLVGAITDAIGGGSDNPGWLDLRSAAVVSKLRLVQAIDDEKKKSVRWDEGRGGRGSHAEDMITIGICCHLCMRPEYQWFGEPEPERAESAIERLQRLGRQQRAGEDEYGGRSPRSS